MIEVVVFAEGQTEEQFIKRVVAPSFRANQIFLKPQTLNTSQDSKGGAFNFDRLKFNARNTLRGKPEAVLTTFIDLYALDTSFPGFSEAKKIPELYARTEALQSSLKQAIVDSVGCQPGRFIPHIQPHEFEGLLFSDVDSLIHTEPDWKRHLAKLQAVRARVSTPEHINDGYETKPSKRLDDILNPKYKKTRHGPLAAEKVTLNRMEQECPHFARWLAALRSLST